MPWAKLDDSGAPGRLVAAVWGEPKTGKTTFALTFPEPIFYFNLDWGLDHHISKNEGREIYRADYLSVGPELTEVEAENMLKSFETDYAAALRTGRDKQGGTIVIDTSTQLWQLVSKVFLDDIKKKRKNQEVYPFDYGNANAYFQNLVNQVKKTPMNMVLIQRAREKWGPTGQPTGSYEIQGNSQVPYLAGVVLHLNKKDGKHTGTIDSCWETTAVEGTDLEDPTYTSLLTYITTMAKAA
jgi:hypothetical protein